MIESILDFLSGPPLTLAPRLTAVLFLACPPWHQMPSESAGDSIDVLGRIYRLLLVSGLLIEPALHSPGFWFAVAMTHFWLITRMYAIADNHRYLEGYWCVALACALLSGHTGQAMIVRNSLLLTGLAFAAAVFWKASNPTFRDSSFFLQSLLCDSRFSALAHLVGGLTVERRTRHLEAVQRVAAGESEVAQVDVPQRLKELATIMTWWTLAIESVLAVVFIIPVSALQTWQLVPLLVFAVSTYVLVPVQTFSNILLLMLVVASDDVLIRGSAIVTLLLLTIATAIGHRWARLYHENATRFLRELTLDREAPLRVDTAT